MKRHIHYRDTKGDNEVKCDNITALRRWLRKGGWESDEVFERQTGLDSLKELVGKWFCVVMGRLYISDKGE